MEKRLYIFSLRENTVKHFWNISPKLLTIGCIIYKIVYSKTFLNVKVLYLTSNVT